MVINFESGRYNTCKFFASKNVDAGMGNCKKNAPEIFEHYAQFPIIHNDYFCGEHEIVTASEQQRRFEEWT